MLLGMRLGAVGMEGLWGVGFLGLLGLRLGVVGMEGVWAVGFLCVVGNEMRFCCDGMSVGSRVFGVVWIAIRCCWDGMSVGSRAFALLGMRLGVAGKEGVWGVGVLCCCE